MVPDLIFDIGMHNGDDTAYYLHKGFRVVAVEANPLLVQQASQRFGDALACGRLILLNRGIGPSEGVQTFWVNEAHTEWSSFIHEVAARDQGPCHAIDVPCVTFPSLLRDYGTPYYLKSDIERHDIYCLKGLAPSDLPVYVSVEAHVLEYLSILSSLGYNAFKCVNQVDHNDPTMTGRARRRGPGLYSRLKTAFRKNPFVRAARRMLFRLPGLYRLLEHKTTPPPESAPSEKRWFFPDGSSGPFGEDTPGPWLALEQVAYQYLHFKTGHPERGPLDPDGWFDFHATKKQDLAREYQRKEFIAAG